MQHFTVISTKRLMCHMLIGNMEDGFLVRVCVCSSSKLKVSWDLRSHAAECSVAVDVPSQARSIKLITKTVLGCVDTASVTGSVKVATEQQSSSGLGTRLISAGMQQATQNQTQRMK
jgi:hypothetical protein